MGLINFVHAILNDSLAHTYLIPLAIIAGTFILEDATTMFVGILAADGVIGIPLAMLSLYLGIILGDFGLYWMGYLAANHRWAEWFVNHERYEPIRAWLEERFEGAVFSSRFVPGMRLPTYTAAGFLQLPFRRFVPPVVIGTLIWTSLFFGGAYVFGNVAAAWLGVWKWPAGILVIAGWFAFNHARMQRRLAKEKTHAPPVPPEMRGW